MPVQLNQADFDRCVNEAIDSIPDALVSLIDNCVVLVEDEPPPDEPDLLGLYDGVPLPERDSGYLGDVPDRIWIFRLPILRRCRTEAEVVDEIRITVVHEIAHYFGIEDDRLDELGYG